MSIDFSNQLPNTQHTLYTHSDIDQSFTTLHNNPLSSPSHHHVSAPVQGHHYDHTDGLSVPEPPTYDIFPNSPSSASFASQRYRTNASSSSSLGPAFNNINGDSTMYSHQSFGDNVPSFPASNRNANDMMVIPSSYSSGKVSPLTPSDSVGPLPPVSTFPSSVGMNGVHKEYSHSNYHDIMPDRRLAAVSNNSYQSDYHEDYPVNNGLSFPPPASVHHYQDRIGRYQQGDRYPHPSAPPPSTVPSHSHTGHSHDLLRSVPPLATHAFRSDGVLQGSGYDDMPHYMTQGHPEMPLRVPSVDETLARMKLQGHPIMGASSDLQTFIRPFLDQYVRTPNRLAFGERSVIVMSSKVAQKSYGTEKRFLCPPPTAIMIGNSWWTDVVRRGEDPKLCPPRVVVSISGEPPPQEGTIEWTGSSGKPFDINDPPTGTTYIGRCVGKQLYISDVDEKKKKVEALVKISAFTYGDEPEKVMGTFPSRPIKVISKPSKKRQSAKNLELCINHGSTISLFHRLRSQTVSTKYLCVSGSGSSFKGSDGAPLMGLDQRSRTTTPSFIARTASWDPFIMYIVDVNKSAGGIDTAPPPPPHADYPSPPPNAIPYTNPGTPIYYNQTVVLQCLTSGVVSPVLIIRKVDHQTTVVGGGLQEGAKGVADHYCAIGEVCGDPVSQLHKIAFEVYDSSKGMPEPGTPGLTGAFLSCMGEKVNTYRPVDGRQWNNSPNVDANSPPLPGSPNTTGSSVGNEYFRHTAPDSAPSSPTTMSEFLSNDGGRVKKPKRSSSSTGGISKGVVGQKGRRRPNSAGSASSSSRRGSSSDNGASSGALWQVDIGEASVWTIVGTDQVRYNFYVPPVLFDNQGAAQTGSFPIPSTPVTPFPGIVKYLPPDRATEVPKCNSAASRALMAKPHPQANKMLTIYGENFSRTEPINVFFGCDPSPHVEVRCTEVVGCLPPETHSSKRRPIILVRGDGVVFPSSTLYP